MRSIKVPSSDRARCVACGVDLSPALGPREVFFRKSEVTRGLLLACLDCRPVLPEAWVPAVLDKLDEESYKVEPTGAEAELKLDVAQMAMDEERVDGTLSNQVGVPSSAYTVSMKSVDLRLLLGDAASKARCGIRGGALVIPGDLCLKVDGEALKAGDVFRGLRVVRDPDIIAKDAPFAYVVHPDSVRREGRLAVVRFKQPEKQIVRPFAKKFFVKESERRFILTLLGESGG